MRWKILSKYTICNIKNTLNNFDLIIERAMKREKTEDRILGWEQHLKGRKTGKKLKRLR